MSPVVASEEGTSYVGVLSVAPEISGVSRPASAREFVMTVQDSPPSETFPRRLKENREYVHYFLIEPHDVQEWMDRGDQSWSYGLDPAERVPLGSRLICD